MRRSEIGTHWWPRTRDGRRSVVAFLAALLLAQPPIVLLANRIEPRVLGVSFLYAWLLGAYCLMIGVLIWAWRRGV
jgi:hypothetical protein